MHVTGALNRLPESSLMFLDSDDRLTGGCLNKVIDTITANPDLNHFLFLVSDRKKEFSNAEMRQVQFEDWIKATVGGDFIHVVAAPVMKRFLFFEMFRMYESLNWLRVFKTTSPQLLVPYIVAARERNRADSLTTAARLQDMSVINGKFESQQLYYNLYLKTCRIFIRTRCRKSCWLLLCWEWPVTEEKIVTGCLNMATG